MDTYIHTYMYTYIQMHTYTNTSTKWYNIEENNFTFSSCRGPIVLPRTCRHFVSSEFCFFLFLKEYIIWIYPSIFMAISFYRLTPPDMPPAPGGEFELIKTFHQRRSLVCNVLLPRVIELTSFFTPKDHESCPKGYVSLTIQPEKPKGHPSFNWCLHISLSIFKCKPENIWKR